MHAVHACVRARVRRSFQVLSPCLHMPPKAHFGLKDQVGGRAAVLASGTGAVSVSTVAAWRVLLQALARAAVPRGVGDPLAHTRRKRGTSTA